MTARKTKGEELKDFAFPFSVDVICSSVERLKKEFGDRTEEERKKTAAAAIKELLRDFNQFRNQLRLRGRKIKANFSRAFGDFRFISNSKLQQQLS